MGTARVGLPVIRRGNNTRSPSPGVDPPLAEVPKCTCMMLTATNSATSSRAFTRTAFRPFWERAKAGAPTARISFKEHPIRSRQEAEKINGVQFSQLHAIELVDFDGDGLLDILTGKRWWAHGPKGDPQPTATPVMYAFLLRRSANGKASYVPHLLNDDTGVGTQVFAADANRDGHPDIIIGNKRGTAVLLSETSGSSGK